MNEDDIVALYKWMLDNPYESMLAFMEATNQDTFGLEIDEPIPNEVMREYLERRLSELKQIVDTKQVLE